MNPDTTLRIAGIAAHCAADLAQFTPTQLYDAVYDMHLSNMYLKSRNELLEQLVAEYTRKVAILAECLTPQPHPLDGNLDSEVYRDGGWLSSNSSVTGSG